MTDTAEASPIKSTQNIVTPCLDLTCNSEDVIAKIKGLDRKIPGREIQIPSDEEEDDEEDGSAGGESTTPPVAKNSFHLKIEIIEDGVSPQKPSPILRRSVTTDVYQTDQQGNDSSLGQGQVGNSPLTLNPCGKCSRDNLDVDPSVCQGGDTKGSPNAARRASSYNRRTVSFCDDVGEIGPVTAGLTPATDSSSSEDEGANDNQAMPSSGPGLLRPAAPACDSPTHQFRRRRSVEVLVSSQPDPQAAASAGKITL